MGILQRNNRKIKAREQFAAKQLAKKLGEDVSSDSRVLSTRVSRRKLRRWSFTVIVEKIIDGKKTPGMMHVPFVYFGTDAEAKGVVKDLTSRYSEGSDYSKVRVVAIPHETISYETQQQVQGLKDLNDILNIAYEMAVEDFVLGKAPAAIDVNEAKNAYYQKALKSLRPEKPAVVITGEGSDADAPVDMDKLRSLAEPVEPVVGPQSNG